MHWVLQTNIFSEYGIQELVKVLIRERITFSVHKITPFVGNIEPDINPFGKVMVLGAHSLRYLSNAKKWSPGVFDLSHVTYQDMINNWGRTMLNYNAKVYRFDSVVIPSDPFFIKPDSDIKLFAGCLMTLEELTKWQKEISELSEDGYITVRPETPVVVAEPTNILREIRFWVVEGQIVTQSIYKIGNTVTHLECDDILAKEFVQRRISQWQPAKAFVIDIAEVFEDEYKVIEINTFNCSGLYKADVESIVYAIEKMS